MKLFIDCETYSELDLKSVGTYRYAANCEVMLVTWAVDNGPVQVWDRTKDLISPALAADTMKDVEIWAHNSMFDRTCMRPILNKPVEKWRDTMVQAFSHGLPGSLDKLCEIYKIGADKAKIKDGRRLIQLFCKPRPKNSKIRRATRETHPEDWAKFIEYAKSDIEAMRVLHRKMPKWNYPREPELSLWHLDQTINDRGVMIDRTMAESVLRAVDRAKIALAGETKEMTGGELASTTQVQATIDYVLREHGVVLDGMTKAQVSKALDDDDMPEPVKELLRIRQQAGSSSTAKYTALLKRANDDDRFRGGIQFAGASRTRRACIAENTLVDVRNKNGLITQVAIQNVLKEHEVWDGCAWVSHAGVVFSGVKDVIEHDGVTATPKHIVWLDSSTCVTMAEAKNTGAKLWRGNTLSTG